MHSLPAGAVREPAQGLDGGYPVNPRSNGPPISLAQVSWKHPVQLGEKGLKDVKLWEEPAR